MTYARFLLVFLVVPIVLLAVGLGRRLAPRAMGWPAPPSACWRSSTRRPGTTTPPRPGSGPSTRSFAPPSHFLLYLPWEEYAFYGLQGILTACSLVALARRLTPA